MLLREYAGRTDPEIAELFGGRFATALPALSPGAWHGPIRSAYGTHLVRVVSRTEPRTPSFTDVRDRVVEDLVAERRREQNEAAFGVLKKVLRMRSNRTSDMPLSPVASEELSAGRLVTTIGSALPQNCGGLTKREPGSFRTSHMARSISSMSVRWRSSGDWEMMPTISLKDCW